MKIGITLGDPLGIGPEVIQKALQADSLPQDVEFVIYGDEKIFSDLWREGARGAPRRVALTQGPQGRTWTPAECGHASLSYLGRAVEEARAGKIEALVTAPICKAHLQKAGYPYPGHTEFLASATKAPKVVMMMASEALKVSLVTIHVPLKEVPRLLTREKIRETVKITVDSLKTYWGLKNPRIAVCGLNPHAGEEGILGREEIDLIAPALRDLREEGTPVDGPAVPDAVFHQAHEGAYDAVVCMYHDQGLIPFKMLHFRDGVNVTLGLPIIRTSPDHGVAFDIAGKGIADPSSMIAAIELAVQMAKIKKGKK